MSSAGTKPAASGQSQDSLVAAINEAWPKGAAKTLARITGLSPRTGRRIVESGRVRNGRRTIVLALYAAIVRRQARLQQLARELREQLDEETVAAAQAGAGGGGRGRARLARIAAEET